MVAKQIPAQLKEHHQASEEMYREAKEACEELKEMYGEENIISAVIHVDETTPPSALRTHTSTFRARLVKIYHEYDRRQKESAQDGEAAHENETKTAVPSCHGDIAKSPS